MDDFFFWEERFKHVQFVDQTQGEDIKKHHLGKKVLPLLVTVQEKQYSGHKKRNHRYCKVSVFKLKIEQKTIEIKKELKKRWCNRPAALNNCSWLHTFIHQNSYEKKKKKKSYPMLKSVFDHGFL